MEGLPKHIRAEMAKDLEEAGLLTPTLANDLQGRKRVAQAVVEVLGKQFEDQVAIVWCIGDVQESWMTEEEAIEILGELQHRHDASIGISWDVIQVYTSDLKQTLSAEELSKREGDTNES